MKISEILITIKDILVSDTQLSTYCHTIWGKNAKIFLGSNRQSPPEQSDMPIVMIDSIAGKEQLGMRQKNKIAIGVIIVKNEILEAANFVDFPGFGLVEELREAVEDAIFRNQGFFKGGKITVEEAESIPNFIFPVFASRTIIGIEHIILSQ